jgi:hypothetical protein
VPAGQVPFGTIPRPLSEAYGPFDLFSLSGAVGSNWSPAANAGRDVAKLQTLFAAAGDLDLVANDGPTGQLDQRFSGAVYGFQGRHALAVDGLVNPDGDCPCSA